MEAIQIKERNASKVKGEKKCLYKYEVSNNYADM